MKQTTYIAEPTREYWEEQHLKCREDPWYFYYWYVKTNVPKMNREQYYKKYEELREHFYHNFK